jgi:uncharacterized protein YjbI with pentapeptide repeats
VAEEFTCQVDEAYRSACKDLRKYPGSRYCVLHEPDESKNKEDFLRVKKSKLARKDYDFSGTVFPEGTSDFGGVEFHTDTDFTHATFIGEAGFSDATFSGESTSFDGAHFRGDWTSFKGTQFSSGETLFQEATFMGRANFTRATFREKVAFFGTITNSVFSSQARAEFGDSRIEKPELLTFNTVLLHAGWFINVDVRKVDFTDVQWYGLSHEIVTLKKRVKEATDALKKRELKQAWYELTATALDKEIGELSKREVSAHPTPYWLKLAGGSQPMPKKTASIRWQTSFTIGRWMHYAKKAGAGWG